MSESNQNENQNTENNTDDKKPPEQTSGDTDSKETISKAEFRRVLDEMHSYKKKAKEYEDKINTEKTARLKEEKRWEELANQRETEAKEARERADRIQTSFISTTKLSEIKEKCMAAGLRPDAVEDLEMLDLEDIQVETTSTGRVNVLGAEKFAERLKAKKPHWFSDKRPPSVNSKNPTVTDSGDTVTTQAILAAEKEGRKSGDLTKYQTLFKKYQAQRAAAMRR